MLNNELYKDIIENLYDGIYFVDIDRKIIFWNKGAERITGFLETEVMGRHCYDNILNHVDKNGCHLCWDGCPLKATNDDGVTRETSVFLNHKEGYRIPVSVRSVAIMSDEKIIGSIEVFRDDSERSEIMKNLDEFQKLALNDQLTGLPNRRYIETFLSSKINEFMTLGIKFGVAFIDIDKFKNFNDTYGHEAGDEVLKMVANTYKNIVRNTDLIGRWGGEEFIAVFAGVNEENLFELAEKIRIMVEASSVRNGENELKVTISSGATLFEETDTIDSVIERADELLYASKSNGRNKVTVG